MSFSKAWKSGLKTLSKPYHYTYFSLMKLMTCNRISSGIAGVETNEECLHLIQKSHFSLIFQAKPYEKHRSELNSRLPKKNVYNGMDQTLKSDCDGQIAAARHATIPKYNDIGCRFRYSFLSIPLRSLYESQHDSYMLHLFERH